MQIIKTDLPGLVVIEPRVFGDERGFFMESYNQNTFQKLTGNSTPFVQDNQAKSVRGVLRGLHYQVGEYCQAKLVSVLEGEVLDVVVDIRENSPTYGQSYSIRLSSENKRQLYVPRGFAHGYVVLSDSALFFYKCDNFYAPNHEGGIRYDDPALKIDWQIDLSNAILSEKDKKHPVLGQHLPVNISLND